MNCLDKYARHFLFGAFQAVKVMKVNSAAPRSFLQCAVRSLLSMNADLLQCKRKRPGLEGGLRRCGRQDGRRFEIVNRTAVRPRNFSSFTKRRSSLSTVCSESFSDIVINVFFTMGQAKRFVHLEITATHQKTSNFFEKKLY